MLIRNLKEFYMNKTDVNKSVPEAGLSLGQQKLLRRKKTQRLMEKETALAALKQAFLMLRPDRQWNNPVMFVVEVGAFLTLLYIIEAMLGKGVSQSPLS